MNGYKDCHESLDGTVPDVRSCLESALANRFRSSSCSHIPDLWRCRLPRHMCWNRPFLQTPVIPISTDLSKLLFNYLNKINNYLINESYSNTMRCNADLILARTLANAQQNETVEYKDRKDLSKDDVGKYFSALSNEANLAQMESAWLLFGITDDGQISNSRYLDTIDSQNELKRYISEQTSNRMSFLGIHERMIDDKRIVLMEIPAALSGIPTSFKGIAYERQGESLLPLSDEKRLRIMGESAPDWSAKLSDNANVCDLDPNATSTCPRDVLDSEISESRPSGG